MNDSSVRTSGHSRHGVALVIALIVLAGLLLLGLPFLFSQSTSLSGSRGFAYHQAATAGREAVEQYAMAEVAEAEAGHLAATATPGDGDDRVSLPDDLLTAGVANDRLSPNQTALVMPLPAAPTAARTGVVVSDEHAKLDPNHLDVAAWDRLLKRVLGDQADWDDSLVWDSQDLNPNPATDNGPTRGTGPAASVQSDDDDDDDFGELAEALSHLRFTLPGQRITVLEQLLRADPGHNQRATAIASDYTGSAAPSGAPADGYGFRRPLTRAELEQLRPYLSVHLLPPGRDGLVDLGNAVIRNPQTGATVLDADLNRFVRPGTVIAWNDPDDTAAAPVYGTTNTQTTFFTSAAAGYTFKASRGFAISAAPGVNLHHAAEPVRLALGVKALSTSPTERYADLDHAATDDPFARLDPRASGRELPPIDIGSWGVVALESAATAHDPRGWMAANRSRRSVVQAVPQEGALERRWDAQDQMAALLMQRFGNEVESWPAAMRRLRNTVPGIATASAGTETGITAATAPSLATGWLRREETNVDQRYPTHLRTDWRLGVGSAAPLDPSGPTMAIATVADDNNAKQGEQEDIEKFTADRVRPDGLVIDSGKKLGFTLMMDDPANHGPLRSVAGGATPNHELRGRHISFWIKPAADNWGMISADQIVPLLEARMPLLNAGIQADATPGHNELQNLLGLYYDAAKECLVLVIAPPIIEHTNDGPRDGANLAVFRTPNDDRDTTFDLDERSLGSDEDEVFPLFPKQPYPGAADIWDEDNALFSSRVSRLYKPNRIVTLCRVANVPDATDPSTLLPFFRKDRWYHIMLVLGGTAPAMNRIIVDGLTGRDVTSAPPSQVKGLSPSDADQLQTGDHLTLPAMPLAMDLPFNPVATGTTLMAGEVRVRNVLGLTASDLFPARGMLRIGDEYLWYDGITTTASESTFLNCSRAHRQNTNVAGTPADYWPGIQGHAAGDLVVPGGYRLSLGGGHFYGGGSTLAAELKNGDPNAAGLHPWMIWSRLAVAPPVVPHGSDPARSIYPQAATTLPLNPGFGVPLDFPVRGIVRMGNQILSYDGNAAGVLQNVQAVAAGAWTALPNTYAPFPVRMDEDFLTANPPEVILIGIPLQGSNPLDAGRYDLSDNGDPFYLQIQHRDTARVEWIRYQQMLSDGATGFILNRNGFGPGTRGQQRTDFCGKASTTLVVADTFPADSQVLPVHAELGAPGHLIATGDVITLLPKIASAATPPRQVLVRYAAMDGYAATGGNSANDTKNEYFAFAQDFSACPELLGADAANYEILVWPGWGGADLTPQGPLAHPTCQMPRIDLWGDSYDPAQARVWIGAMDSGRINTAAMGGEAAAWNAARQLHVSATIDAVVAGNLRGMVQTATTAGVGIVRVVRGGSVLLTVADDITIGDVVEASYDGFFPDPMGLIAIGGETYAWRQPSTAESTATISALNALGEAAAANNQRLAVIIGRGLLDDDLTHQPHGLGAGPMPTAGGNRFVRGLIPAVNLPLGPVAVTETAIADQAYFRPIRAYQADGTPNWSVDNRLDAPVALACAPTGTTASTEIIGLTVPDTRPVSPSTPPSLQGYWYATAPWLRGMYNTPAEAPRAAGDLIIGWWPRHPSALPASDAPTTTAEHFRCRQYAWAGFPIAFHQARFDLVQAVTGMATAELTVHDTSIDDLFTVEIRAAATGMDWKDAGIDGAKVVPNLGSAPLTVDASAAFSHGQFSGVAVSGAELHVTWHYRSDGTHAPSARIQAIAEAGGRSPRIGPVRLRCLAPCAVLAVEDAK